MINSFNNFKINRSLIELKNRIFILLFYLIIFRIGSFIPIPNVNINIILNSLSKNIKEGYITNMFNLFSGGSLRRASILSLGIVPYMSSSIIIELLCITFDYFKEKKNDNENNKYKINKYIYLCTILISIFQSIITIFSLPNLFYIENNFKFNYNYKSIILSILSLTSGTLFLVWLSNQITINSIGNGTSMIMFSGIASEIPENIINIVNKIKNNLINIYLLITILIILFALVNFIIFVETGQKKIIVNYYKKYNYGKKFFNIQYTYLPIKINISGVTPIIFASTIITTIFIAISYINKYINNYILFLIINILNPDTIIYNILYIYTIFLFYNLYSSMILNHEETSDNLKKSGAYISGIRPGNQTSIYIKEIINKISLIGSFYISIIFLISNIIKKITNFPITINSISILIIVVVILDIINQIKSIMISNKYDNILKKINIKNKII